MRLVSTAICTSAEPVSPVERACSVMMAVLSSLVSVMFGTRLPVRVRAVRRPSQGRDGHLVAGPDDVGFDCLDQGLDVLVALLVAQASPELDREGLPRQIRPVVVQEE